MGATGLRKHLAAPGAPPRAPLFLRGGLAMRFQLEKDSRTPIYDQIREQLISALHGGNVQAGAKLPSVRHFARVHGINPKTVHRIYRRLHEEGYLELRPGSGAYVADVRRRDLDGERLLSLHRFFRSSVAECQRMGVDPDRAVRMFESYVSRNRLPSARIAVVECTREQLALFTYEIRARLGTQIIPVMEDSLDHPQTVSALRDATFLVTTEHHMARVAELARSLGKHALQVRARPDFFPALMKAAEQGVLLMVLSSTSGWKSFVEAARHMGLSAAAAGRIQSVAADDPAKVRELARTADTIYVSRLVRDRVDSLLPPGRPRLQFEQHLSMESMDLLEAALLFGTRSPS